MLPRGGYSSRVKFLANAGMLATATLWGLSFISTRVLSDQGMHPVEIYMYRFLMAYLVLLAVCHKHILSYSWRDEGLFVLLGLTGGSIYFIAENIAVTLTDVANVSLITTMSPIITVFLVAALYRNERPSQWIVIGSFIAIVGVVMVVFGGGEGASFHPAGDLLALGAAVSFSVYSIIIKKLNVTYSSLFITRKSFFYGLVTALPLMLMEPEHMALSQLASVDVLGNLLFLGIVCSLLGFLAMARAIQVIGPVKANNYLYVQPIVTMIAGWIILGERVLWTGWTGCALIIGGLWLGESLARGASGRR